MWNKLSREAMEASLNGLHIKSGFHLARYKFLNTKYKYQVKVNCFGRTGLTKRQPLP